jgi:murein DD-endopeptidase MepM/ murein hydrolase activator NlpD
VKSGGAGDAKVAGQQLEAFFLRQLLSETRPAGGGAIDGGFAGDTFKGMLDEAIADKMSKAGGIGMASIFSKQLEGKQAVAQDPHPSGVSLAAQTGQELGPGTDGAPRLAMPVIGRASSGYGMRNDPIKHAEINHPGFDLAAPTGTPVTAAAGGTVVHAGPAGTYGNLVTIRHDNGFETRYAHLSAVDIKEGARVEPGQLIGKVGTTGYSTGPHLHFEVRHDGQAIDPAPLLPLNSSRTRSTR